MDFGAFSDPTLEEQSLDAVQTEMDNPRESTRNITAVKARKSFAAVAATSLEEERKKLYKSRV